MKTKENLLIIIGSMAVILFILAIGFDYDVSIEKAVTGGFIHGIGSFGILFMVLAITSYFYFKN